MSAPLRFVVSAAGTGAGKTLVASALAATFARRGLRVRPYKIGPDYIDAYLATLVCGRPAHNVDAWLDGDDALRAHVEATSADADVLLFEGMMGLYDGDDAGTTSTAHVTRLLGARTIVVLDGWSASQTLAAVALGLRAYDPELAFAGAILNRVGGPAHERAVRDACARVGMPVLATIGYDASLVVPERRLGLDRAAGAARVAAVRVLAERLEGTLDFAALGLGDAAFDAEPEGGAERRRTTRPLVAASASPASRPVVALAEDDAFWFTYPETRTALEAAGARVVPFSPLAGTTLPPETRALWLGGGYPESYAAALAANVAMRGAVRAAVVAGMPTYAECGGYLYLLDRLATDDGDFPMAGAIRGSASSRDAALTIGYREASTGRETPLDAAGTHLRAYAYHYARPDVVAAPDVVAGSAEAGAAYRTASGDDGVAWPSGCASFLHRHFLTGDPAIARFVARAAAFDSTFAPTSAR